MSATQFGTTIPRGVTSFYGFSQNDDGEQPGANATQDDGGNGTPAPPPLAIHTLNGNYGSNSSTSTTTTTTSETSPYAQFKGNNYAELENFLRSQMDAIKPETKEEREKREKREKRVGFLARLAEGLGTFHTAYSHARGVKAMDMPKMSAKAKELFEKAKALRDKDNDRLVNYAIALGNIKDKDRDFNFRVTQAEQQQNNSRTTGNSSLTQVAKTVPTMWLSATRSLTPTTSTGRKVSKRTSVSLMSPQMRLNAATEHQRDFKVLVLPNRDVTIGHQRAWSVGVLMHRKTANTQSSIRAMALFAFLTPD